MHRRILMSSSGMDDPQQGGGLIVSEADVAVRPPSMYRVLLHNDDYTPMDFVVELIQRFFNKSHGEATNIMLMVHQKGRATCGVYTAEIAEIKVAQVLEYARNHEYPLQCTMEKV